MKKILIILLFSLCLSFNGFSVEKEDSTDDFKFTYNSSLQATITRYKGSDTIIYVPRTITETTDKKTCDVVAIESLVSTYSTNQSVTQIVIPSCINTLKGNIINLYAPVKTIIFESGDITLSNNAPFELSSGNDYHLDNIIFLSTTERTVGDLFGSYSSYVWKTGTIQITQTDGNTLSSQLFIVNKVKNSTKKFTHEQYDYLLNALEKNNIDLSTIASIDLKDVEADQYSFSENYDLTSKLALGAVVKTEGKEYINTPQSVTITDKVDYNAPASDIETTVSYHRENVLGWNSVCLPFDIKESDFGADIAKIYTIKSADNDAITLRRMKDETISAGTPCFVKSSASEWNLEITTTLKSGLSPTSPKTDDGNWQLVGSFTKETIGEGKYKLDEEGESFGMTNQSTAAVYPFRCYLEYIGQGEAPLRLSVNEEQVSGIQTIEEEETECVICYDLLGRQRRSATSGFVLKRRSQKRVNGAVQ